MASFELFPYDKSSLLVWKYLLLNVEIIFRRNATNHAKAPVAMKSLAVNFFLSTVRPTVDEFLRQPLDVRRGRLAAIVLHQMYDYWIKDNLSGLSRKALIGHCPDCRLIWDVAQDNGGNYTMIQLQGIQNDFGRIDSTQTS